MEISKKVLMGFSFVIFIAVIIGVIGISGMVNLHSEGIKIYERQVNGLAYAGKAAASLEQVRLACHQVVISSLSDDFEGASDSKEQFETNTKEFEYWIKKSSKVAAANELQMFHYEIQKLFYDIYLPESEKIIEASIDGIPEHADKQYMNELLAAEADASSQMENLLTGLMDLKTSLVEQSGDYNGWVIKIYAALQFLMLIIAAIAAVIVSLYIKRSITVPINEASKVLKEISKGNFDVRVKGDYKGKLYLIKNSVNETAIKLSLYLNEKIKAERSAYQADLEKARVEAKTEAVFADIEYASKIQKDLLPKDDVFREAFSDYSIIWKPRDRVGGDIYWIRNFEEGTVLCVCDCTGHGTSGALLTMLVASTLEASVRERNYKDTANVIWKLEQKLVNVFHVNEGAGTEGGKSISEIRNGCDIAVLYVGKDGNITISSGNTHVFICDGREVTQIKGQKLYIGEGRLKCKEDVQAIKIPANPENKFYIASDGLYDQIGGEMERPFGYRTFKRIILENHNEKQAIISERIWMAFENYRGGLMRRDDVELITFKP